MGQSQSVKENISRAEKTGVLQLSKVGIKEIPAEMLKLRKNLRNLELSENKIELLPTFVGEFQALKQLSLADNRISHLPDELCRLTKLETLSLCGNPITQLPMAIAQLTQLKTLHLARCRLTEIPQSLCRLPKLELLDLSGNQIRSVPDHIGTLAAIELNLSQNQISCLSRALVDCPRLKILRLEENCLPLTAFSREILAESKISTMGVEGNLFDMKEFRLIDGYEDYMEKYTATKKKMY